MSKLTILFYVFTVVIIALFGTFIYLMTTVNPEPVANMTLNFADKKEKAAKYSALSEEEHDEDYPLIVDERATASETEAIRRANAVNNTKRAGAKRVTATHEAEPVVNLIDFSAEVAEWPENSNSSSGADLINTPVERHLKLRNGTLPLNTSKGRRSINDRGKKKNHGVVVMRVVDDEGKPRIEIVLYPKHPKSRKLKKYIRDTVIRNLKSAKTEILHNPILNIMPDDTAFLVNRKQYPELEIMTSEETSRRIETITDTSDVKSLWINSIRTSNNDQEVTKQNTYLLPSIMKNTSTEVTMAIVNMETNTKNNPEGVNIEPHDKIDEINAENVGHPTIPDSDSVIQKTNDVWTDRTLTEGESYDDTVKLTSTTQTGVNKIVQTIYDNESFASSHNDQGVTKLKKYLQPSTSTEVMMAAINEIKTNKPEEVEIELAIRTDEMNTENVIRPTTLDSDSVSWSTIDVSLNNQETSHNDQEVKKLNSYSLPSILENTSAEATMVSVKEPKTYNNPEEVKIEPDIEIAQVNTDNVLNPKIPDSDSANQGTIGNWTNMKLTEAESYNIPVELTSTMPIVVDEIETTNGIYSESNETFANTSVSISTLNEFLENAPEDDAASNAALFYNTAVHTETTSGIILGHNSTDLSTSLTTSKESTEIVPDDYVIVE